jgi:hypothetical protein
MTKETKMQLYPELSYTTEVAAREKKDMLQL